MGTFPTIKLLASFMISVTSVSCVLYSAPKGPITRDVAIIGGGSAGTHAAITLSDMGLSVIVVEKASDLGGPDVTYVDPVTNTPVNYAVQVLWNDIAEAATYLDRLGVSYTNQSSPATSNKTVYMDFSSGAVVNSVPPADLSPLIQQVLKYPGLVHAKQWSDDVPQDLTLPFRKLVEKYRLEDSVFLVNNLYGAETLNSTSLDVLSAITPDVLPTSTIRPASGSNHEIYDKALQILGEENVLLNSVVHATRQSANGTTFLMVETAHESQIIQASHLVITIPPLPSNMNTLSPDGKESAVFAKFTGQYIYIGLVRIFGLPVGQNYNNAQANSSYHLPPSYGLFSLSTTVVPGLFDFFYLSKISTTEEKVKAEVLANIKNVIEAVTGKVSQDPRFVEFRQIGWRSTMSGGAIEDGAWRQMYALQGYRNRWYSGLAFLPSSPQIWNYTKSVIAPKIRGLI